MFKLNLFTKSVAFSAVLAASLTAVSTVEARPGQGKMRPKAVFNHLDANQDGVITIDEVTDKALERAERRFTRKDADENGEVTFAEATSGREPRDLSDIAEEIVLCVTDLKAETGDENIIVPDLDKFMSSEERFASVDTDGSETISLAESEAKATEKAAERFAMLDDDESGDVTEAEFQIGREVAKATKAAVRSCVEELAEPL